jgi:hypothetical protein
MDLKEYIKSEAVQTSLNSVFDEMMKIYGWSYRIDLQNFYDRYVDLVVSGKVPEILFNQTSGYYQDVINKFDSNSYLTNGFNFIENFVDLGINRFEVPENLLRPQSWFNELYKTQQKQNTNTGSIFGDALKLTGQQISDTTGNIFSGVGDLIGKAFTGIFSNPIILMIVIGIIVFVLFKGKIIKALNL